MVQTVRLTMDIPQLLNTVADVPVVLSCSSRVQTWRRQLSSHSCSPLNSGLVVACPLCATDRCRVVRSAENCVCPAVAALWLGESFFKGPVHKYTAGGRVHRDTAPIIRCTVRSYRQRFVRSTRVRTTTTTTTTTTRKAGPLVVDRGAQ